MVVFNLNQHLKHALELEVCGSRVVAFYVPEIVRHVTQILSARPVIAI